MADEGLHGEVDTEDGSTEEVGVGLNTKNLDPLHIHVGCMAGDDTQLAEMVDSNRVVVLGVDMVVLLALDTFRMELADEAERRMAVVGVRERVALAWAHVEEDNVEARICDFR